MALALSIVILFAFGQTKKAAACRTIDALNRKKDCKTDADGGVECAAGDLAPQMWGLCVEDKKREFTCLKDETISHYADGASPAWSMAAKSCPALRDQIKAEGKDHEEIELPLTPITPPPPKPLAREDHT